MDNTKIDNLSEAICTMDKIEAVTKVLNQSFSGDLDFNRADNQNLCSILLREISYTKEKLTTIGK